MTTARGQQLIAYLVTGDVDDIAYAPTRLRSREGAATLKTNASRLAVNYALRCGGATQQPVFDNDGEYVAEQPLWSPAVVAVSDWRLSSAATRLVKTLWERLAAVNDAAGQPADADAAPPLAPLSLPAPQTAADTLLWQALAEQLGAVASRIERPIADTLLAASPMNALFEVKSPPLPKLDEACWQNLQPLVCANWLLPYLNGRIVRCWLGLESRRGWIDRAEETTCNQQLNTLMHALFGHFVNRGQPQLLRVFIDYYAGQWRHWRRDVQNVLNCARKGDWTGWTNARREDFERTVGQIYGLVGRLGAVADDLIAQSHDRTPAGDAFLHWFTQELTAPAAPGDDVDGAGQDSVAYELQVLYQQLGHVAL